MAATKTAIIKLGSFTRQVTKANKNRQVVIDECRAIAAERNLIAVIKRDYQDRWQGFAKRHSARGANHRRDYEFLPEGRRARKMDEKVEGGQVYVANIKAANGLTKVEVL